MSASEQLETIRLMAIKAFNDQTNTDSDESEWKIALNRFNKDAPLSVRLYRDKFTNGEYKGSQMQIDFSIADPYTEIGVLRLMLLPNIPSGDLRDEIFVAKGKMEGNDYKDLLTYIRTTEVREYLDTEPRLNTLDGSIFCVCSGQPFQTLQ